MDETMLMFWVAVMVIMGVAIVATVRSVMTGARAGWSVAEVNAALVAENAALREWAEAMAND